jgi:hypothetical protein
LRNKIGLVLDGEVKWLPTWSVLAEYWPPNTLCGDVEAHSEVFGSCQSSRSKTQPRTVLHLGVRLCVIFLFFCHRSSEEYVFFEWIHRCKIQDEVPLEQLLIVESLNWVVVRDLIVVCPLECIVHNPFICELDVGVACSIEVTQNSIYLSGVFSHEFVDEVALVRARSPIKEGIYILAFFDASFLEH